MTRKKPRRKRCHCCDRLRDSSQVEVVDTVHWGKVTVCREVRTCADAVEEREGVTGE